MFSGASAPTFKRNVDEHPQNYMTLQGRISHSAGISCLGIFGYMVNLSYPVVTFYHLILIKNTMCFLHQRDALSPHTELNGVGVTTFT
jgi:hypothetical protein